MAECEGCGSRTVDLMAITYYGTSVQVCFDCEIEYDDLACDRCGGEKSRKAKLCRSCDQEARGWPYSDSALGRPITRWLPERQEPQ